MLSACPQTKTPTQENVKSDVSKPDEAESGADKDPQVVVEKQPPIPNPGSGMPDESNGECRLFAPKLPKPECCKQALGFDVSTVHNACENLIYMGESFYGSCGYYFLAEKLQKPVWFRLKPTLESSVKDAVHNHDEFMRNRIVKSQDFKSEPVPGVEGAYWSQYEQTHWAFIPGWSKVRQFTWHDESCSQDGVVQIIKQLRDTPEIPANTPRTSLVPTASPPS